MEPAAHLDPPDRLGRDRGRALLVVVALLACAGAVVGTLSSTLGGEAPAPCEDARVRGAVVVCGEDGEETAASESERPGARAWLLGDKLDLNRASAVDLARIPGVGRNLARAIVDERERRGGYRSLDEVDDVRGVGPAKLRLLERYVEVKRVSETPPTAPAR